MTPEASLQLAVEELYGCFKRYKLLQHVDGCPHCVGDRDHATIHAAPLRELTSEQLSKYAFKALTTWGDANDFRHFLPRIFELIAFDPAWGVEIEVVTGKLSYTSWNRWPEFEQTAVRDFFSAWWLAALSSYPCRAPWQSIDEVLCSIGRAEDDLAEYLHMWLASPSLDAKRHLASFVSDNYPSREGSPEQHFGRSRHAAATGRGLAAQG
jgi:hypothetical protein